MEKTWFEIFLILLITVGLYMGLVALFWMLFVIVAQTFWPGHGAISDPTYWQFFGLFVLVTIVAGLFKGESK